MDKVATYTYALGSASELREGNLKKLRTNKDSSKLIKMVYGRNDSGLVVPRFMGVYQTDEFIAHTNTFGEREALERIEKLYRLMQLSKSRLTRLSIFSSLGVDDEVHPDLIMVTYDPNTWTEELVRVSLDDKLKRVAIVSAKELPKVYNKNTTLAETIIERGQNEFEITGDREKSLYFVNPMVQEFAAELELYGSTREEYAFLRIFKDARSKVLKVITPCSPEDIERLR